MLPSFSSLDRKSLSVAFLPFTHTYTHPWVPKLKPQPSLFPREDPKSTFAWFFEAAYPTSLQEAPPILRQFPKDFCDQELMQMVPKFCFPFDLERAGHSLAAQHFTFVLTDLAGSRRFGFCRLGTNARSCLCILSDLPWFEVFYKLLNSVGDLLAQDQVSEAEELLSTLYLHPIPGPEAPLGLSLDQQEGKLRISSHPSLLPPAPGTNQLLSCFIAPVSGCLPSIPENRNLTELVVAVASENIVGLYSSLLSERRVLLSASKLSTLTACVHASCGLLYPMHWEHILIPTLPPHLLDYCCAPMPYLIGVHTSLMERLREKGLEDVVILDVDTNTLESPFQDVETLPPDVVSLLKLRLRKEALAAGDGVSRLFLRAQAVLFGGYRDALICRPGQPVTFSKEAFLAQKPGPLQAFRQNAIHLQLFKQFIDERLEKLNSGEGFSDLFEQEITSSGLASGSLRSYQLWADNLKKGGGALLHSVKAKTQPAVRNMYRSAKIGLKEVQNRLRYKDSDSLLQRGGSLRVPAPDNRSERLQHRLPITHHFGQSRPLRPRPQRSQSRSEDQVPWEEEHRESHSGPKEPWGLEDFDSNFLGSGELDLLGEILDNLSIGIAEPGESPGLHPSHSLDNCHLDQGGCFKSVLQEEEETPEKQLLSPTIFAAAFSGQGSEETRTSQTSVETEDPQLPSPSHQHFLTDKELPEPHLLPTRPLAVPHSSQAFAEAETPNICAECRPPSPVPVPQNTGRGVAPNLREGVSVQPRVSQLKKRFEG
ncbi:DENN domain-containing protein 1C isoform X2 [Monodelphis domestica]|uniref:DENN domain-containing protein 1C isoform X2 n=1 Tax=Monodelphis domestica TaxID=13616 RepID=UPI0024E23DB2|nr:DENN domain-containing protein 1C isoform X2 [Monodelphis domestica]